MELYNEDIIDLLNPQARNMMTGREVEDQRKDVRLSFFSSGRRGTAFSIREDAQGGIVWLGIKEEPVSTTDDLFE